MPSDTPPTSAARDWCVVHGTDRVSCAVAGRACSSPSSGGIAPASDVTKWLLIICRCSNKNGRHGCHHAAELCAKALGEPTERDRELVRLVR